MSYLETIKAVSEYGLSLLLSAIVIYGVIRLLKIVFDQIEGNSSRKKHDEALEVRGQIDDKVYAILNEFLEDHTGSRIQVIEFTNSVMSVAYLPFKYMSCTYEVCEYGLSPLGSHIDRISTSLFAPFLSKIGKEDYLHVTPDNYEEVASGMASHMYEKGSCNEMIFVMMKSHTDADKCIGYVSLFKDKSCEQRDFDDTIKLGAQLSALLGVLDK